jgi:hypothetical protein
MVTNYEIMNILLGIIIGYVLYKIFISPTVIKGPNSRNIIKKVYIVDGTLYKLKPIVCMNVL